MKKIVLFLMAGLFSLNAFAAPKKMMRVPDTISEEIPDSELVKVTFASSVVICAIDGIENEEENLSKRISAFIDPKTVSEVLGGDAASEEEKKYLDKSLASFKKNRTVLMEPGNHVFAVRYNNGKSYTPSPNTLRFNLEAGKEYKIVSKVEKNKVVFDFVNPKDGVSYTNPNNYNLHQKAVLLYVERVLGPAAEGKKVHLQTTNGLYWYYGPDLTVQVKENYSEEHKGFIGFVTDKDFQKATVYIKFNDDDELTKDEFLNLKPEECDRVYEIMERADSAGICLEMKIVKPIDKTRKTILMSIYSFQ